MKLLIVCVNYNSYNELDRYLNSIEKAAKVADISVKVIIADNSTNTEVHSYTHFNNISVESREFNNLGYLGAAQRVINEIEDIRMYDYIAISNVDIELDSSFLDILSRLHFDNRIAQIAPSIMSSSLNRDMNPKIVSPYSLKRLKQLLFMYSNPWIYYIYHATAYRRKKIERKKNEQNIYAGHGSFMLFTKHYFEIYNSLDYPIFLYGEELYFAEQIRKAGLLVRYVPSLIIKDEEHVSTSTIKRKKYFEYNRQALSFIIETYFK